MKAIIKTLLILLTVAVSSLNAGAQKRFKAKKVYKSAELVITRIAANAYVHTSYLQTNDFGKVPCNGLIVRDSNEVIVFDTPSDDKGSTELIRWIRETLHARIRAIIPTHFHNDCLGGLKAFHDQGIPSYAYFRTIELAREKGFVVPQNGFRDSLVLPLGNEKVVARFFGEGHTRDNVVGYFPAEKIMFGGCLVKEWKAGKGFLGDANVAAWSATVERVKKAYPEVRIVVPGHGEYGNASLLDYTIGLFQ